METYRPTISAHLEDPSRCDSRTDQSTREIQDIAAAAPAKQKARDIAEPQNCQASRCRAVHQNIEMETLLSNQCIRNHGGEQQQGDIHGTTPHPSGLRQRRRPNATASTAYACAACRDIYRRRPRGSKGNGRHRKPLSSTASVAGEPHRYAQRWRYRQRSLRSPCRDMRHTTFATEYQKKPK